MKRLWSLLTPAAGGRRRGPGVLVLALAVLVPLVVLLTLVPQRGAGDVPVALVNLDMPVQESVDGSDVPVAAGKLLTESLVHDPGGIAWTLTDPDTARAGLEDGAFLAVVTIPSDFSKDASSLAGAAPVQAQLQVQTSTSHGYLIGAVADAMTAHLPEGVAAQLTQQYVGGTLGAFAQLRSGVGQAGDAASEIAAATGQAAEGARQLGAATEQLTGGLDRMTSVLRALPVAATDLGELTAGGAAQAAQLSLGLAETALTAEETLAQQRTAVASTDALVAWIRENPTAPASDLLERAEALRAQSAEVASRLSGQGGALALGAADAAVLVLGAETIASVSRPVADGLGQLADAAAAAAGGSAQLADGDAALGDGLDRLSAGSGQLAGALAQVSGAIPDYSTDQQSQIASVVSSPIAVAQTTVAGPASAWLSSIAAVAPVGLWLGAFVLFLVLAPFARSALSTPASAGRIALDGASVAVGVALIQGIVLWGALALLGAAPERLPVALAFVMILSASTTLVHQALVAAFGRAGFIVSAVLLGLQLVAAGTLTPASLAPVADTPLSLLPLSLGLQGAQALVGGSLHEVLGATVGLAIWAGVAFAGTMMAVSVQRRRSVASALAA